MHNQRESARPSPPAQGNCTIAGLRPAGVYTFTSADLAFAAASLILEGHSFYRFATGEINSGETMFGVAARMLVTRSKWTPIFTLGALSPLVGVGFTVAKLFPGAARYACKTFYCTKLVHNAAMTLASAPFDAAEIFCVATVENALAEKMKDKWEDQLGPCERWLLPVRPLLKFFKSGNLACSAAWIIYDLVKVRARAHARMLARTPAWEYVRVRVRMFVSRLAALSLSLFPLSLPPPLRCSLSLLPSLSIFPCLPPSLPPRASLSLLPSISLVLSVLLCKCGRVYICAWHM
jgi:hypothetical protein